MINLFEKKKLTDPVGVPVAETQNAMTAGPQMLPSNVGATFFQRICKSSCVAEIYRYVR